MSAEQPDAVPSASHAGDPLEVVILAGGLSHEREVSIRSGRRVAEALRAAGAAVTVHDLDTGLLDFLRTAQPDVVWPLLHGSMGEDGAVRELLAMAGVPFVGTDAAGARTTWSKPVAASLMRRAGAHTPESATLPQSLFREVGAQTVLDRVVARLPLPLVVKPAMGGSALGVTVVTDRAQLPQAMVHCFSYGETALIERAVEGTEVAVSVVDTGAGPRALPAVEIATDGPYDYDARYNAGRTEYFAPARLSARDARTAAELAVLAHETLGLQHISRTDMILDSGGLAWFLDANVAPGMTETSLFPQAVQAAEHTVERLYLELARAGQRAPR
ncbi:D-alanine--D-alanine ligase family protein [Ruania halotolerans]|uniref:D-alanine--D-alanine ligase family protein n=1 Tax=Ruania halotolerans TaxID=2897773 RepID=UPI001E37D913|nr:ATP-grasp domain-containing protein [Ruania halotolerans]UFU06528.1 ATP-grasp domain-containing protein [Ruania halotolerans]